VLPGAEIGERSVVGAGAVVLHSVPAGVTVVGIPARVIRRTGS
jgi:serine acetyltransferase